MRWNTSSKRGICSAARRAKPHSPLAPSHAAKSRHRRHHLQHRSKSHRGVADEERRLGCRAVRSMLLEGASGRLRGVHNLLSKPVGEIVHG